MKLKNLKQEMKLIILINGMLKNCMKIQQQWEKEFEILKTKAPKIQEFSGKLGNAAGVIIILRKQCRH